MARSCGIRLGRNDFELLILEGSVKKPHVVTCVRGSVPADSEDPLDELVDALQAEIKGLKVPTDAIGLVVDSGLAAFRRPTLPFDDASKIEQVIKFEIESRVPQWDIDDVIVDFFVAHSTGVESHLLTTVVPKAPLAEAIEVATRAGLEPLEAEADTSAMVNAAWKAEVLHAEGSQLLVHVGATSTSMVVVDGGKVRSMRSARLGSAHSEDEGSRQRLLREINRTVAGMQAVHALDGIYLAGMEFPGIVGTDVEGVTLTRLEAFEADQLPEGTTSATFAAAYGAALARMGSVLVKSSLRRENLRFAGKLERLELPLAVLALLLAAVAGIQFVVLQKEKKPLQDDMQRWLLSSDQFMLGVPKQGTLGHLTRPDEKLRKRVEGLEQATLDGTQTEYGALLQIRSILQADIRDLKKKLGQNTDIRKPQSAFGALTRVLQVLDDLGQEQHGYFSIRDAQVNFRPARNNAADDQVEVKMSMTFFSETGALVATEHWDNFRNEVRDRPWCLDFPETKTQTLDGGGGIFVESVRIDVDMSVIEEGDQI
ncbi:MAG: hypothetical protein H8D72_02430 [Planctomycetes bacterium]|nr:hypothetical protein [Planctomycetota bacterium]